MLLRRSSLSALFSCDTETVTPSRAGQRCVENLKLGSTAAAVSLQLTFQTASTHSL